MLPVGMFVASGFEHCVANMFMIPMGVAIEHLAPAQFWAAAGVSPSDYSMLTFGNFITLNLIPVTIGNIIGGGVFVGLGYWAIFRRPELKAERAESQKIQNKSQEVEAAKASS